MAEKSVTISDEQLSVPATCKSEPNSIQNSSLPSPPNILGPHIAPHSIDLNFIPAESRPFRHAHIIRRPRPLQYWKPTNVDRTQNGIDSEPRGTLLDGIREKRSTVSLFKQLGRLELFIDLVWVGIIANISKTFSAKAFSDDGIDIGEAFLEFILLFVPIWRMWDHLRAFGSNFYNDDMAQRQFMCWILLLAVLYGINAPYAFSADETGTSLTLLIGIYLVAQISFLNAQATQCFFMPFLRRQFFVVLGGTLFTAGLWISAIWVPYPSKVALLVLANVIEHQFDIYILSPTGERLITGGWKKIVHIEHYIERHEGFFILILGEGVFSLIYGSPSGLGLNTTTGTVLNVLLIYYMIHWLYFDGDQAREYVHALRWSWWRAVLWQMCHVWMFGALLVFDTSNLYLVQHRNERLNSSAATILEYRYLHSALWSSSISLSIALACMTVVAMLNKGLDQPKTLVVNSRWMRLAPRLVAIAILLCLPLFKNIGGSGYCGGTVVVLYVLFVWEWIAGLESGWGWFERRHG